MKKFEILALHANYTHFERRLDGRVELDGCNCGVSAPHDPHVQEDGGLCQGVPPKNGAIVITDFRLMKDGTVEMKGVVHTGKVVTTTYMWHGWRVRPCGNENPHDPHAVGGHYLCEGVPGNGREPVWLNRVKGCAEWECERTWYVIER